MADNAARKARARREEAERDARDDRAAANYDPWGKAGGGAPRATRRATSRRISARMRNDFNDRLDDPAAAAAAYRRGQQQLQQHAAYGHTPDARLGGPDDEPGYHPGHRDGRLNPTQGARGISASARPCTLARSRRRTARDELQRALAQQIEEKRRRKEEEKRREEEEELREERRLREEQEMLREAYERERAEGARARGRTRARGGGGVYPRGE